MKPSRLNAWGFKFLEGFFGRALYVVLGILFSVLCIVFYEEQSYIKAALCFPVAFYGFSALFKWMPWVSQRFRIYDRHLDFMKSKKQPDSWRDFFVYEQVDNKLSVSKSSGKSHSAKNRNFYSKRKLSREYYTMLKEFEPQLVSIAEKLKNNQDIILRIGQEGLVNHTPKSFIQQCIIYESTLIGKMISGVNIHPKGPEALGLALLIDALEGDDPKQLTNSLSVIETAWKSGTYDDFIQNLIELSEEEPIMDIKAHDLGSKEVIAGTTTQSNFSLSLFLKMLESPLLGEYATVMYRFANILTKADGVVTPSEEQRLKDIFQILHHPLPSDRNEHIQVIENNEDETLDDVLHELNSLIGLEEVKREVNSLVNFIRVQKAREQSGLKSSTISYHMMFTGNPGTGKTTVARIVAKIYKHLGILTEGHLIETDRAGLVAEFAGQTAVKTNKVIDKALNGVLFIDEAYALVGENKDDFGRECVATIIKRMEDDKDKLVLILAGYTDEMESFIATNPGFKSRINRHIEFPDYQPKDLIQIFEWNCKKLDYQLTSDARSKVKELFERAYESRDRTFGNGRFSRNIFEKVIENQANRIASEAILSTNILTTIEVGDIMG